jgi:hypothetical protein
MGASPLNAPEPHPTAPPNERRSINGTTESLPNRSDRMARENAHDKARRYLTEGRLRVLRVDPGPQMRRDAIFAQCRGDSGEYFRLGYDAALGEWRCSCSARSECSHLKALKLVTTEPDKED